MQIDFLKVWFPPINLYSVPHIIKITRMTEDHLIEVSTKHKALHDEWLRRGRPRLDWKLATEPDSAYRPMNSDLVLGPIWSSTFDFRFAERRSDTASTDPETDIQRYWFRKGYNRALEDVKENVTSMAAKRSLEA